jgi:hypothetical protein
MTRTPFGVRRDTVRSAGWPAVIVVIATAMLLEPWLANHGLGAAALVVYVVMLPVLIWSLVEDVRSWREQRGTDN